MSSRARGYTYRVGPGGKRKRVYRGNARRPARRPTRRMTVRGLFNPRNVSGFGAYYGGAAGRGRRMRVGTGPPTIRNSKNGVIIRHREFISDIVSSIAFASSVFTLNPGLPVGFPWLSRVAQNFESWKPRGMLVEYRTTSSDTLLAANPALGSVVIATQYNTLASDFVNKQAMENYEGATSCKPSVSMIHLIETGRAQTLIDHMDIRSAPVPANADARLYDLGKVQVSTVGSQAAGNIIGELWISYEVELMNPRIPDDPLVSTAHFLLPSATVAGTETPVRPFGTGVNAYLPTAGSSMGDARVGSSGAANGYITLGQFSEGLYMVVCNFPWTNAGTQGAWTVTAVTNCTVANAWNGNAVGLSQEIDAGTATAGSTNLAFIMNATGAYASVTITSSSNAAGTYATNADVYICEMTDGIN